jgi:transcriptional regulator with XRE-family HTH domain
MGFPLLIAAIRNSGLPQWRIAELVGISESRLSRIARRGTATDDERRSLSRLLGVSESELFAPGPAVSLNLNSTKRTDRRGGDLAAALA